MEEERIYTEEEIRELLSSKDPAQIKKGISISTYVSRDYEKLMDILREHYFSTNDLNVKDYILSLIPIILSIYGNIDIDLVIDLLKDAFSINNASIIDIAEEIFDDVCHRFPEHKYRVKDQLKDVDLSKYDYMFATKADIRRALKKRRELEKKETFCCEQMQQSVQKDKIIDYDDLMRNYDIRKKGRCTRSLNFCPWCGVNLGAPLNKEYFKTLEEKYNIEIPDLTNFTNIPDEFKCDEWWKKRGL